MTGAGAAFDPQPAIRAAASMALAAPHSWFFMRIRRSAAGPRLHANGHTEVKLRYRWDDRAMADGTMSWTEVAGRLSAARTYWLGSTTPSRPPPPPPAWAPAPATPLSL